MARSATIRKQYGQAYGATSLGALKRKPEAKIQETKPVKQQPISRLDEIAAKRIASGIPNPWK